MHALQGRQGEAANGAVAMEGTEAVADKVGALPAYSAAMGQLHRMDEDAARQTASLAGLNPQQVRASDAEHDG